MIKDAEVEQIINDLENYNHRNMGQFTLAINNVPVKIQRRGVGNYVMYFFENKKNFDGLDIKLATKFMKLNKEELEKFLKGEK